MYYACMNLLTELLKPKMYFRNYAKYFNQALKVRRLISNDFDKVWEDVQLLLTPTTLSTAPLYSEFVARTNRDQCALQDYCTQPANMAGNSAKLYNIHNMHLFNNYCYILQEYLLYQFL